MSIVDVGKPILDLLPSFVRSSGFVLSKMRTVLSTEGVRVVYSCGRKAYASGREVISCGGTLMSKLWGRAGGGLPRARLDLRNAETMLSNDSSFLL